jgi:melanoma-associated antigen
VFDGLSDPPFLQEKDKLVAEVMRYVLFKTHQSSDCPIKREELTGIITKNYRQRALPTLVINEAKERLAATFGYEMRELQRTRAPATRSGRPAQRQCKASFFSLSLVYYYFVPFLCMSTTAVTGWQ